jgi:hypothetical protein
MPCHRLDRARKALTLQANLKMSAIAQECTMGVLQKRLWSASGTSDRVTTLAESVILSVLERTDEYIIARTSMTAWDVWFRQDVSMTGIRSSAIPRFHRIRRVHVIPGTSRLSCSCCRFESIGLPCVHQAAVLKKEFPDWESFSHQDVSVRWWKIYSKYGYSSECVDLAILMEKIRRNDVAGPALPNELTAQGMYISAVVDKPVLETVVNYTQPELQQLIPEHSEAGPRRLTYEGNLTQESFDIPDNFEIPNDETFHAFDDFDEDNSGRMNMIDEMPPILHVQAGQLEAGVVTTRERLKPFMTELCGCLDTAGSEACFDVVEKGLDLLIAKVRKEISKQKSKKRKRKPTATVNIMTEQQPNSTRRNFASRNC